ncbi:MAG: hypothetical protein ACH350_10395 [Parachlamydiaceae bacterium]
MKNKFIFLLSAIWMLLITPYAQAYTILNSKTEVSPGYEGGVLSQSITSTIQDSYKSNESEALPTVLIESEPDQFDLVTENQR